MQSDDSINKWSQSAEAWIRAQGANGDWSRRAILDPALETILVDVKGKTVLDVGCGEGRYSRLLAARGAKVTGVDPVKAFIDRCRSKDPRSDYHLCCAESLPFPKATFDLVISYLSMIDIADYEAASREISRVLKPNGEFVLVSISNMASTSEGWMRDLWGRKLYRPVDRYMEHFSMELEWKEIRIINFHRPLSFVLGQFLSRGMVLTQFLEPLPPPTDPKYSGEFRCPNFQIYVFKATVKTP